MDSLAFSALRKVRDFLWDFSKRAGIPGAGLPVQAAPGTAGPLSVLKLN